MNYGGAYRNTPGHLVTQAAAENLQVVEDLVVNKEQRIPDIAYFSTKPDPASTATNLLLHGQEFHTSYWGHMGLLNLTQNFLLPGYAAYPNTAAASLFPANANVADMAHAQHALVGYVHPYDSVPDPAKDPSVSHELPVDLALGKVDYIEVTGFAEHKSTASGLVPAAELRIPLADCGRHRRDGQLRFAARTGGIESGLRQSSSRPAQYRGLAGFAEAWPHLRDQRTFAGILARRQATRRRTGLAGRREQSEVHGVAALVRSDRSSASNLQWRGGARPEINGDRETADVEDTIPLSRSGWCLLRAWSEKAEHPILDMYPYATTSPIYVKVAGSNPKPAEDAAYFVAWIDRMIDAAKSNTDWNTRGGEGGGTGDVDLGAESLLADGEVRLRVEHVSAYRKIPALSLPKNGSRRGRGTLYLRGCGAFHFQQCFFAFYSPAIASHVPTFPDNAVAGDRHRHRIGRAGASHRTSSGRLADRFCDLAVRASGAERNGL